MMKEGVIYNGDYDITEVKEDFTDTFKDFELYLKDYNRDKIITIIKAYFFEKPLSKKLLDKNKLLDIEDTKITLTKLIKPLKDKYDECLKIPFNILLKTATKDFKDDYEALAVVNKINLKTKSSKIKRKHFITSSVHGLNKYSKMNAMVFLAALRPKPTVINFYEHFISDYKWTLNLLGANIVQALCRLNIRDIDSTKPTYLYVPTERTARLLQEVLHKVLDYASPDRLPALTEVTEIISINSLIKLDRKKRKIKEHLLLKDKSGSVIGKTTIEDIFRKDDKYRKLMSDLNACNRKLKIYEKENKHKGTKEYKILIHQKQETSETLKKRRITLKSQNNL